MLLLRDSGLAGRIVLSSDNHVVYYATSNRSVVCAVGDTGEPVWISHLGERYVGGFTIDPGSGMVFVQGGTTMYGLDMGTGDVTWQVPCGNGYATSPTVAGDTLLYGTVWGYDLVMAFSM